MQSRNCSPLFLSCLSGFMLFMLSNYLSSRYWFRIVMSSTISALKRCSIRPICFVGVHVSYIMSPLRTKGDILFQSDFFFRFRFFCFFSAKLVRTITFLSFQIGQLYLVCGCMTIRRCVAYRNDLCGTLTFDLKVK